MNVTVQTSEGAATICGDVIYDFNDQIIEPFHEISDMEPRVTGNHGTTKRQEKAAIKKVLARSRFALPIHDFPALIEGSQVVGRIAQFRARPDRAVAAEAQLVAPSLRPGNQLRFGSDCTIGPGTESRRRPTTWPPSISAGKSWIGSTKRERASTFLIAAFPGAWSCRGCR